MAAKKRVSSLREVDLEAGMPYADQAIQRLTLEIRQSRKMGCTASGVFLLAGRAEKFAQRVAVISPA